MIYLALFFITLLIFGILYSSRRVSASLEKAEESRPGLLADVAYYTVKWIMIFSLLGFVVPGLLMSWPPRWMERRDQREEVFKRVESAGGWAKLAADTHILIETNCTPSSRILPRYETNFALPAAIAALKPRDIQLSTLEESRTALLQIYGVRSTGGRGQPYYWLYIVDQGSTETALKNLRSHLVRPRTIRPITNGVFEVY
ncbi:MAG TPA: hypothetical protein PKA41_07325 [Verrucomicrobiota bacterium]|nr:hypothetical protein [Verrucomicrobiota bacterium]